MRVADKIASAIMDKLEDDFDIKFKKRDYLTIECVIADTIKDEFALWMDYDVDLNAK